MNKLAFLIAAAFALPGWAQPADGDAERARIASERARVEAEFEQAHRACYARFAVNDCISDARATRREQLADLRRQELALNDAERRRRGEERLRDIESRTPPQPRAAASAPVPQAPRSPEPGPSGRAAAPAAAASAPARPAPGGKPRAQQARTPDDAQRPDTQENQRRYEERLRQAQEHKARVERRAAEQGRKDVRPLPVPP